MPTTITDTISKSGTLFLGSGTKGDGAALTVSYTAPGCTFDHCTIQANGSDWGLKLPNNLGSRFNDCMILGGTERALDIVRGGDLTFNRCNFSTYGNRSRVRSRFNPNKQCDAGIKGGARFITFNNCAINDLLLGDYSIYDHDATLDKVSGIALIDCYNPNGGPIIVRALNATRPSTVNTDIAYLKVPDWAVTAYFAYCRRYGDTRVGTK